MPTEAIYDMVATIVRVFLKYNRINSTGEMEHMDKHAWYKYNLKRTKASYVLQALLRELLESQLFTLKGLARELDTPCEMITNLFLKAECDPSYSLAMSIIHLHYETFPQLYTTR